MDNHNTSDMSFHTAIYSKLPFLGYIPGTKEESLSLLRFRGRRVLINWNLQVVFLIPGLGTLSQLH